MSNERTTKEKFLDFFSDFDFWRLVILILFVTAVFLIVRRVVRTIRAIGEGTTIWLTDPGQGVSNVVIGVMSTMGMIETK